MYGIGETNSFDGSGRSHSSCQYIQFLWKKFGSVGNGWGIGGYFLE